MAKPIQYVQQYVPTDMNLVQNVLGMARQDMKERNQAFDAAAAYENSAIGQAYGIETWDTEYRNKIVEGIQGKIDEAVKKRGGDYAVAGNDIAKVIMKERGNPFWNDNAKQMESLKQYRELSRDADNEIIGDPRMSYEDVQRLKAEGKDPFALTAVKKSEVRRTSSDYFRNFANTMRNGDGTWKGILYSEDPYTNQKMNQYYQNIVQYGFKDEKAVDEFLAKPEGQKAINSLLSSYPQLEGAGKERITEIIKQGALSGIGKSEDKTLANQGFGNRPIRGSNTNPPYNPPLYPTLNIEDNQKKITKDISLLREGLDGDNFNDSKIKNSSLNLILATKEAGKDLLSWGTKEARKMLKDVGESFGIDLENTKSWDEAQSKIDNMTLGKISNYQEVKKVYTDKYSNVYDKIKNGGFKIGDKVYKGDKGFLDFVEKTEIERAVSAGTEIGLNDYNIATDLKVKNIEVKRNNGDANTLIPVDKFDINDTNTKGKSIAFLSTAKIMGNTRMRQDGNLTIQVDPDGKGKTTESYVVNPRALGLEFDTAIKSISEIEKIMNSYNLTKDDIKNINESSFNIAGREFAVQVDPKDPLKKTIMEIVEDKDGNFRVVNSNINLRDIKYLNFLNAKRALNAGNTSKSTATEELDEDNY